jgi:hypothetical protein
LNRHCVLEFTVEGEQPPCPRCGGTKVKWLPRPFAIRSEATRKVDATVAEVVAVQGDKNYASPVRGERMAPRVNPTLGAGLTMTPSGIPVDRNGNPQFYCGTVPVTAATVASLPPPAPGKTFKPPTVFSRTRYEGRHRG